MAYYEKVNCNLRDKLYTELILENHPLYSDGPLKEALIQKPKHFDITHIVEDMMAENSMGAYNFVDGIHCDFSDGSECKTGTLYIYESISFAEITNVRSNNGVLKSGAVRCVILNPQDEKLHFILIPSQSLKDIMMTKSGKEKKSQSAKLSFTKKDNSFDKFCKKYGLIEFKTFKELAQTANI